MGLTAAVQISDSQLILQSGLCSVLHCVVGKPESFLHGKSAGVQKLQEHFNISAHDIVQDDIFPAVFRIGGEVSVLLQGIFEHLTVCAGKHTAVIINYKGFEVDAVFFVNVTQCIQQADKSGCSFAFRGENLFQQGELPFFDSGEDVFDRLKIEIESGTMDSGALYDLLYGNAPEFLQSYEYPSGRGAKIYPLSNETTAPRDSR